MAVSNICLEVCVDHVESAIIAVRAGADRLELCQALELGGLTPSLGLIAMAKEKLQVPSVIMVRPRSGNFIYSAEEALVMLKDIELGVTMGVDGFVTGALRKCGDEICIDEDLCQKLIEAAKGVPVTFHRAFDLVTINVTNALETVIKLGFKRILTSGRAATAMEGLPVIRQLVKEAKGRIIIMPGSGISSDTIKEIYSATRVREFHASGRGVKCEPPEDKVTPIVKGTTCCDSADFYIVQGLRRLLEQCKEEEEQVK